MCKLGSWDEFLVGGLGTLEKVPLKPDIFLLIAYLINSTHAHLHTFMFKKFVPPKGGAGCGPLVINLVC